MTFVDPIQILGQLDFTTSMTVADFGSGSGGWVIPLASRLEQGRVFAIDLQEDAFSALTRKANAKALFNIRKILVDIEKGAPQIRSFSCDWVLMTNLLFEIDDKEAVFQEANRILKQEGKILVVDWKLSAILGPKQGKISSDQVKDIAEHTGFLFEKEINAGDYHYALVFTKA